MAKELTNLMARFVAEFVASDKKSGRAAAIAAGYSEKTAAKVAHKLLGQKRIQDAIAKLSKELAVKAADLVEAPPSQIDVITEKAPEVRNVLMNKEQVLAQLGCIASIDPAEMFFPDGGLKPIHEIPLHVRLAIKSIETRVEITGRGEDKESYLVTKIQLWDKIKANQLIGQHLALWGGEDDPTKVKQAPTLIVNVQGNANVGVQFIQ